MNCINLIGRLTREPELRRTQTGTACCSFCLAVRRPKAKDTTDFINLVVWQQGAEYLSQYGHKGDLVGVTGYLTTRNWEDQNGNKRSATEVTCDSVELLTSKKESDRTETVGFVKQQKANDFAQIDVDDAALPF